MQTDSWMAVRHGNSQKASQCPQNQLPHCDVKEQMPHIHQWKYIPQCETVDMKFNF